MSAQYESIKAGILALHSNTYLSLLYSLIAQNVHFFFFTFVTAADLYFNGQFLYLSDQ